jgi:thermitase
MWKYVLSFIIVLGIGALLFPRSDNRSGQLTESLPPAAEMQMKQATLQQDMQLTADLCRSQCNLELGRMLSMKASESPEMKRQGLQQLQAEHPHMEKLIWTERMQPIENGIQSGSLNKSLQALADNELKLAKAAVDRGQSYQSAPFENSGTTYFVLGVPSEDSNSALIGVVNQSIVKKVEDHQLKNLRIVNYPADNHYKIESVDAQTLEDVKVDHPEQNQNASHYHVNQVVVRFNQEPSAGDLSHIQSEIGAAHPYQKLGYTYIFESGQMEAKQLMTYFKKWNIAYAEPHFLYLTNESTSSRSTRNVPQAGEGEQSTITPNDSLYSRYQWNLPLVDTELGWEITKGSQDVIVGIIDTGVDLNHPDLKDQLVSGYNVVENGADPMDDVGHGTHVAGVIGAVVNNHLGVAGMSWYNRIMPVKALDQTGAGSTYAVAQGLIWATDHGAKVINMSLGNYADANFLHDAIRYAYDHDVVLIAASGNDNSGRPGFPAAYPEVFAVAAADANRNKASFSNYGDYIDVAAPGVSIASTYPHNQYAALSGTSMASPHVTALAALIRSANKDLTNEEVMQIMRETASDAGETGRDIYFGYGIIDVVAALKKAAGIQQTESSGTTADRTMASPLASWIQQWLSQLQAR